MKLSEEKQAEFERMVQAINGDSTEDENDEKEPETKPDPKPAIVKVNE